MEMVIQEAKKNLAHTDMLFTLIQLLGVCVWRGCFTVELVETIKNGRRAIANHSE